MPIDVIQGMDFFSDDVKTSPTTGGLDPFDAPDPVPAKEVEPDETSEEESQESEDETETEEDSEEESSEEDAGEDEEAEGEGEDDDDEERKTEQSQPTSKPGKNYEFVAGDAKVPVSSDAVVKIKVQGQPAEVKLAELVDSYNSQKENYKQFQNVTAERKKLEAEQAGFNATRQGWEASTKLVIDLLEKDEIVPAIQLLIAGTGRDPIDAVQAIREKLVSEITNWGNLSEDEKKLFNLQEKNKYLEGSRKAEADERALAAQKAQARQEVVQSMQRWGVPDEQTFIETYQDFRARCERGEIPGVKEINAEIVCQWYDARQVQQSVISAVEEVAPGLREDTDTLSQLVKVVATTRPTPQELRQAIAELAGTNESKEEAPKKALPKPKTSDSKEARTPKVNGRYDAHADWS